MRAMRVWLTPAAWILACGLLASVTGCVSRDRFNDVLAANDRSQAELANTHRNLELVRAEREQALAQLEQAQASLRARDAQIRTLSEANTALERRLRELGVAVQGLRDAPALPPVGPLVALPAELDAQLQEWARQYPELVEYDRVNGMVKLKTDLLFPRGSDQIPAPAQATLRRFAEIMQGTQGFHVYVAGHTDNVPIRREETRRRHPTNWYLSVHRAVAVVEELIDSGLAPTRIGAAGFSMYHPVAPNAANNQGNPLNRRVELWIVPPDRLLTTATLEGENFGDSAPAAPADAEPLK